MFGDGVNRHAKQGNDSDEGSGGFSQNSGPFSSPGRALDIVVPYWELRSSGNRPAGRPIGRNLKSGAAGAAAGEASFVSGSASSAGSGGLSLEGRLDDLLRSGVNSVTSFVPWQVLECDISHRFSRFLQAVSEREMNLTLLISPEPGLPLPGSGLPRDLLRVLTGSVDREGPDQVEAAPTFDSVALSFENRKYGVMLPPRAFPIPSLQSIEFQKRFPAFLSRLDTLLTEVSKASKGRWLSRVRIGMGGSYYRYMRPVSTGAKGPFEGLAGDASPSSQLVYHGRLDRWVQEGELGVGGPLSAQKWKGKAAEPWMRRRFAADQEQVFRLRMVQSLSKKWSALGLDQFNLWVPESDPWLSASWLQQSLHGTAADYDRVCRLLEELLVRQGTSSGLGPVKDYPIIIYFNGNGVFGTLSDAEKQQLLLKALVLVSGHGGKLWIEDHLWFELSSGFRSRLENLGGLMQDTRFRIQPKAIYWSAHLWSESDRAFASLSARLGGAVRMVDSARAAVTDPWSPLVWVDTHCLLESESVAGLVAWAKSGRVVVVPSGVAMTELARREIERELSACAAMELKLGEGAGGQCRLLNLGAGKWVWWESAAAEGNPSTEFVDGIVAMAEIDRYCQASDSRMKVVAGERDDGEVALFVFNESPRTVSGDLIFPVEVGVTDLGARIHSQDRAEAPGSLVRRLNLELPAFGVIPLAVTGLNYTEVQERRLAQMHSEVTDRMAVESAVTELPGFSDTSDMSLSNDRGQDGGGNSWR